LKTHTLHTARGIVTAAFILGGLILCHPLQAQQNVSRFKPSDKKASKGVVNLYRNMALLAPEYIMIGHQDALSYGIHWKTGNDRSDLKAITGSHPAVFGWEDRKSVG